MTLLQELKQHIDMLSGCCLGTGYPSEAYEPTRFVMGAEGEGGEWSSAGNETSRFAMYEVAGGALYVVSDNEDYTGHGCQCGASISGPFGTVDEAVTLGLTPDERRYAENPPTQETE